MARDVTIELHSPANKGQLSARLHELMLFANDLGRKGERIIASNVRHLPYTHRTDITVTCEKSLSHDDPAPSP